MSQIHLPFQSVRQPTFYYVIKTTPSDPESHEEQDGTEQKFLGRLMAKLWAHLCQGVTKNMEEK